VEIVDVHFVGGYGRADFIGGAVGDAAFYAAAGEP
jgi:hypothetical protein